jgi:esterase
MSEAPVRDQWALLNGLRFHYREWGDAAARPLVLLHGYTGHARSWDSFAAKMAADYRVLALDQRGHGETSWADDYSPEAMVSDVHALTGALKLANYDLLGLSMGGRNAYAFAADRPAGLERLVIVDIGPDIVTSGSDRIAQGARAKDTWDTVEDALADYRKATPLADPAEAEHRLRNNMMLTADGQWTWRYDAALRGDRRLPRPDATAAWEGLRNITADTLVMRGDRSDILAPETAERMVREIPRARFALVANAGHSIPLDNPSGFYEAAKTFL